MSVLKPSEKLEKLVNNDLHEWFKELCENTDTPIDIKIQLGQYFSLSAINLQTCIDILKKAGR